MIESRVSLLGLMAAWNKMSDKNTKKVDFKDFMKVMSEVFNIKADIPDLYIPEDFISGTFVCPSCGDHVDDVYIANDIDGHRCNSCGHMSSNEFSNARVTRLDLIDVDKANAEKLLDIEEVSYF